MEEFKLLRASWVSFSGESIRWAVVDEEPELINGRTMLRIRNLCGPHEGWVRYVDLSAYRNPTDSGRIPTYYIMTEADARERSYRMSKVGRVHTAIESLAGEWVRSGEIGLLAHVSPRTAGQILGRNIPGIETRWVGYHREYRLPEKPTSAEVSE